MLPPSPPPLTLPYYSATSIFPLFSPSLSPLWLYNALTRGWLSNWNWKWNCCKNKKSERKERKHIKRVEGAGKYASTVPLQRVLSVVPARESGLPWKPYTASLPACLPACLPVAATLTVLSAQCPDSVPSSSQHTHVAFFITGYAHKCRTWRGCTVQVQEVEGEEGGGMLRQRDDTLICDASENVLWKKVDESEVKSTL